MSQPQPDVRLQLKVDERSVHLEYEIRNVLTEPIYVFDRLYDMRSEKLADDWAYVAVEGQSAIVARQVSPLPAGLLHENPETPYGRLLAPHATVTGQFALPLPLIEHDPYLTLVRGQAKLVPVKITSLVFRAGWGLASQLHAGSPVQLKGEELVLFPFYEALSRQQLADSNPAAVKLPAKVFP